VGLLRVTGHRKENLRNQRNLRILLPYHWQIVFLPILLILAQLACSLSPSQPTAEFVPPATPAAFTYQLVLPLVSRDQVASPTPFLPAAAPLPSETPIPPPPTPENNFPDLAFTPGPSDPKRLPPSEPPVTPVPQPMPLMGDQGTAPEATINILLVGSDQRGSGSLRTDAMIIASLRPAQNSVSLISIPRDLFVYIPGWTMQRINTAHGQGSRTRYPGGGMGLLKDTIRYNLGIRIDYTAIVDFNGFVRIVDTLDGVEVPIACAYTDWRLIRPGLNPQVEANWRQYTAGPGVVHMDGDIALWYARSRMKSNDYDRGRRQQELLRALYQRALTLDVIPRLPELYQELQNTFKTDLSAADLFALAPMALNLSAPRIRSYYINNTMVKAWWTPGGAIVLLPRRDKIEELLQEAMSPPGITEDLRLSLLVEIQNASGNPDWPRLVEERLSYAGFDTRMLSGDLPSQSQTMLYDYTPGQNASDAQALLNILGLSPSSLAAQPDASQEAAYHIVLGADYQPCFKPSRLVH
jgi:LCP family protein required for cell wall assembly